MKLFQIANRAICFIQKIAETDEYFWIIMFVSNFNSVNDGKQSKFSGLREFLVSVPISRRWYCKLAIFFWFSLSVYRQHVCTFKILILQEDKKFFLQETNLKSRVIDSSFRKWTGNHDYHQFPSGIWTILNLYGMFHCPSAYAFTSASLVYISQVWCGAWPTG